MAEKTVTRIHLLCSSDQSSDYEHRREFRKNAVTITIEHYTSSNVDDVGFQVWKGAFLLSDYLISIRKALVESVAIELGAGCGFCGVILSLIRHEGCFVTDYRSDILNLARENLSRNEHLVHCRPFEESLLSQVLFRQLDWFELQNVLPTLGEFCVDENDSQYLWTKSDEKLLASSKRLFLAADVIYDDILTEALFLKLSQLMRSGDQLILTLEKRINCTLSKPNVTATGYELFLRIVHASETTEDSLPLGKYMKQFQGKQIDFNTIPQCVCEYERNEHLELWEITCLT